MFVFLANLSEVCYACPYLVWFRVWPTWLVSTYLVYWPQLNKKQFLCTVHCTVLKSAMPMCQCKVYCTQCHALNCTVNSTALCTITCTAVCWSLPCHCLCVNPLSVLRSTLNCSQRDDCHSTVFVTVFLILFDLFFIWISSVFHLRFICICICISITSTLNSSQRGYCH